MDLLTRPRSRWVAGCGVVPHSVDPAGGHFGQIAGIRYPISDKSKYMIYGIWLYGIWHGNPNPVLA
jgi:hypothetical protein